MLLDLPLPTRAALAAASSLGVVLLLVPRLAEAARRRRFADREGKSDSDRLNELHQQKRHTPIVGGLGMLAGTLCGTLLAADLREPGTWVLLLVLLVLGGLGIGDDWTKTFGRKRTQGLTARQKLVVQVLLGLGVGGGLLWRAQAGGWIDPAALTTLFVPLSGWGLPLGAVGFVLFAAFLLTGSSNAVNLTDGLDGLAGGCSLVALGTYALLGAVAGDPLLAARFGLEHAPGAGEVAVVLAALAGGVTGFLVYNRHPARVFMGDTGSLPLGGVLAAAALLVQQELLLALVGGVFVAEALSVLAQVTSFKLTGKRVLRCAPLHHHFEFAGWKETTIVGRFHAAAIALAVLGLVGVGLSA